MALCTNAKISFCCFLIPCLETFLVSTFILVTFNSNLIHLFIVILNLLFIHALFAAFYKRTCLLGQGFAFGLLIVLFANNTWKLFGIYLTVLCFFHFSEYFTVSVVNPKTLSLNSFLLNHSREYTAAAIISWVEFLFESHFFPRLKLFWWFSVFGLFLCVSGEVIRKAAMITAGANFNHVIQSYREEGHVLVTHGIYSICRHPSYVGWFLWSVGTQIILVNPICIIGYTVASWMFFKNRIKAEEISLLNFFGEDYVLYQKCVKTGIPFVNGYRVEL
ncbi:protein-S-isoprenylcysteine O-methyltransferase-like protein [Leptotrombidium deliense]|uniref:Protein-S-isoprenylcysteine O-methyltransferase n=1 Tax=Leptotrombidium deliense TaxID=299467 RepID=A0A443S908_9ACAR|nr:protein-S-isoprenylcysteine O-methyltransferase-like protein [Leptotrombidium deliense]